MYQICLSLSSRVAKIFATWWQKIFATWWGTAPLVWADTGVRGVRAAVRHSTQGSSHPAAFRRITYTAQNRKYEKCEPSFLLLILASIAACISQRLILTLLWFCAVWSNTRIAWPGVGWGMFYTAVKTTKSTFQTGRVVEILLLSNTNHQTILQFFQYINF